MLNRYKASGVDGIRALLFKKCAPGIVSSSKHILTFFVTLDLFLMGTRMHEFTNS